MQDIKCPKCGEVFVVDESSYAQIVKQVRDAEFEKELKRREEDFEEMKENKLQIVRMAQKEEFDKVLLSKEKEISEKDKTIENLKAQISEKETEKKLAISETVNQKENERELAIEKKNDELADKEHKIEQLKAQIENNETEKKLAISEAVSEKEKEISAKIVEIAKLKENFSTEDNKKEKLIEQLKAELKNSDTAKKLAVSEAIQKKDKEISEKENDIIELNSQLSKKDTESELKEQSLKREYEAKLKAKDEQIEYYKDFKIKQSTKMIGESLEQYCLNEFNSLRMAAFPNAYFEKDNDIRTGSKGDFIFRESAGETEYISIMFEMKNEMDETATKHKNEDFFKELDKDRREKKCEYAILVSMLESDNELYNKGIVDVSYKYEKMYVIRPQFFIPIITLLRNAALNSLKYQQELEIVKHQQVDILHFEENMNEFKEKFARNYRIASERFNTAIEEIDKTISHLQKIKDALLSSQNNLRLASNKADELSIKKLTKNAPAVKEMFDETRNEYNMNE